MQPNLRSFTLLALGMILLCVVVYICGWPIPLMEIDAVQYANISREMMHSGQYLQIYDRGHDYLDKPPMLFWLSAFSMKIFGVSGWAYRLPSFGFALLAIYSTYRLTLLYYRKEIALLSALILASSQALFLINHDVRTDTMLMGWVTLSLWQLAAWYRHNAWKNLILAAIAIAGGMMTKGPIALMIPVFCFSIHFHYHRSYKNFFRWEYIPMLLIIGALLIPMCIGLYQQYDLHPGKVIDRLTINSGLRFFFWTQSFGRITGESNWHENGSFLFLFQNMLWSFLPWIILFLIGLFRDIRHAIKSQGRLAENEEFISTGGFLLTYTAFAISNYQLPHYIFVAFPLASIIAAKAVFALFFTEAPGFVPGKVNRFISILYNSHLAIFTLLWLALIALLFLPFNTISPVLRGFAIIAAGGWIYLLTQQGSRRLKTFPWLTVYTIAGINLFLNLGFYPALLDYQLSSVVKKEMQHRQIAPAQLYAYKMDEERALDFYTDHLYQHTQDPNAIPIGSCILTDQAGIDSLGAHPNLDLIYKGGYFHVSTLDLPFLNPSTRNTELKPIYILRRR